MSRAASLPCSYYRRYPGTWRSLNDVRRFLIQTVVIAQYASADTAMCILIDTYAHRAYECCNQRQTHAGRTPREWAEDEARGRRRAIRLLLLVKRQGEIRKV